MAEHIDSYEIDESEPVILAKCERCSLPLVPFHSMFCDEVAALRAELADYKAGLTATEGFLAKKKAENRDIAAELAEAAAAYASLVAENAALRVERDRAVDECDKARKKADVYGFTLHRIAQQRQTLGWSVAADWADEALAYRAGEQEASDAAG